MSPPELFVVNSTKEVTSSSHTIISSGSFISAVGFTVKVNVSVGPSQPSKVGVTTTVDIIDESPVFIDIKDGILPVPDETNPILGESFIQLYVVVPSVFSVVNDISVVSSVLHNIWLSIESTWPEGVTVIVNVCDGPSQLTSAFVNIGVTIIVATTGIVPVLIPLNEDIFPVPEASKPILSVSFVQEYVVIPNVLSVVNSTEVLSPLHISLSTGLLTWAVGFTVIVNISVGPSQLTPSFV